MSVLLPRGAARTEPARSDSRVPTRRHGMVGAAVQAAAPAIAEAQQRRPRPRHLQASATMAFFNALHSSFAVVDKDTIYLSPFFHKVLEVGQNELLKHRDVVGGFSLPLQPAVFGG